MIPTAAGERLFAVIKPFMAELDICLKTLEQSKDKPFGELRIGGERRWSLGRPIFQQLLLNFGNNTQMLHSVLTVDSHQAIISAIQHHVGMGIIASYLVSKEI